jgi:mono/diheme cytochrome c family protein
MSTHTVNCLRALTAVAFTLLATAAAGPPAQAVSTGLFTGASSNSVSGGEIYQQICQGCHMPNGQGASGAGSYPALAGDPALVSSHYMALTVLQGRRNMPAFGVKHRGGLFYSPPTLTNEQVAAVVNFVRTHFGNHYTDVITTAQVAALDQAR